MAAGGQPKAAKPAATGQPKGVKPAATGQPEPVRPAASSGLAAKQGQGPARTAQPHAGEGKEPGRRRLIRACLIGAALAIIATGSMAITLALRGGNGTTSSVLSGAPQTPAAAARDMAAVWVTKHVSQQAVVSCDPQMCSALEASGFPAGDVRVLGRASPYPLKSALVMETAAVRELFGRSLSSLYAPDVLAAFGSGNVSIRVRVIAPHGATAYRAVLAADLAARTSSGAALLQAGDVTVSSLARKQLIAGQVDSRLLIALAALASSVPVDIADFGNVGSGASADIPLRFADLAATDQAAHLSSSAYVQSLRTHLNAGPGSRPDSMSTGFLPGGQALLRVEFAAPSPLGLLGP